MAVLVGSLGDHLLGNLWELNKTSTTLEDSSEDILSFFNGIKSISVILWSSVGEGLLGISHWEDDSKVFLVGEGLLFVNIEFVGGSDLLGFTASKLGLRVSEDVGGILDLSRSESVFRLTFSLLSVVDLIVVNLFSVNGISEVIEDVKDGIKRTLWLELVLDLHHDVHDASLLSIVEWESLGKAGSVYGN